MSVKLTAPSRTSALVTGQTFSSPPIIERNTAWNPDAFAHRIDMLDAGGKIQEHLADVEDLHILAEAVWREAIARWPGATIILRQGARVVHDTRRPRVVK
jgi:hypothetical protein